MHVQLSRVALTDSRWPRGGDPAAKSSSALLASLFDTEYLPTLRLARLLTGSLSAAEDISQEAFIRIREKLPRLERPAGYLRTTTVNLCHNWHRSNKREAAALARVALESDLRWPEHDILTDAIYSLAYRQRAVLVLRYWLDLSESDIAAHLRCRPGTVKSLHARAIGELRKVIPDGA